MPFATSALTSASARAADNLTFMSTAPTLSVWPTTKAFSAGVFFSSFTISASAGSESGLMTADPVSKWMRLQLRRAPRRRYIVTQDTRRHDVRCEEGS